MKFLTNITMQENDGKYIFGVVKVGGCSSLATRKVWRW